MKSLSFFRWLVELFQWFCQTPNLRFRTHLISDLFWCDDPWVDRITWQRFTFLGKLPCTCRSCFLHLLSCLAYFWCLKSWMSDNYQVLLRLGSTKTFWWTGDCISFLFVPSSTCGKFGAWPLAQSSLSASMGLSLKICHIGILGFIVNRWLLSFQSDLSRTRSRMEKCLSYAVWALEFFLHWFHNSFSWKTNFSRGCFEFHRWLDRSALCSNQEQLV